MNPSNEPEDKLLQAIQSGTFEPDLSDPSLARAFAAYQKLEAIFERLRQPAQEAKKDLTTPNLAKAPSSSGLRFRILRPHGKGGMGEVFVALDEELHREVALKQIRAPFADDPQRRARFIQEAEITGQLEHPGIVPVYSLGQHPNSRPFYAMRLVQGESLREAIPRIHERCQMDFDRTTGDLLIENRQLRQFIQVCNTVAYAHSRGIIHRDLKPDNILLGHFGEVYIVDWGLAKPFNKKGSFQDAEVQEPISPCKPMLTKIGSIIGTPQFMSPEQGAGALDQLGPPSDIYSLGATLYYMMTGKPPFPDPRKIGLEALLIQIQKGQFTPPGEIIGSLRIKGRSLEDICLKAMALHPENRYASASEMALDIENFLDHKPVLASADIRRMKLLGQLKLAIYRNQNLAFETFVTEPIQLGRQGQNEEEPYSMKVGKEGWRLIMAPQDDNSVSEKHAVLESLECGRVRIVNLSLRLPIQLVGGHELLTNAAVNLALPVKFWLGNNLVELNWVKKAQEQPSFPTNASSSNQQKEPETRRGNPLFARIFRYFQGR